MNEVAQAQFLVIFWGLAFPKFSSKILAANLIIALEILFNDSVASRMCSYIGLLWRCGEIQFSDQCKLYHSKSIHIGLQKLELIIVFNGIFHNNSCELEN